MNSSTLDFSRIGKFIFEKSGIEKSVAEMSVIDAINTYISQPPAYHGINVINLNQDCPFFGIRHDIIGGIGLCTAMRIHTRKTWNTDFIIVCQNLIGLYS